MDEKTKLKKQYIRLLVRIISIFAVLFLIFRFVFMFTQMHGTDMYPAIKDGDLMIAFRMQGSYEAGDIVSYVNDGKKLTGRIAAVGGDIIDLNQSGAVYVNGTAQSGEINYPTYPKDAIKFPFTVPEGDVFILCDYRTNCVDSRDFGTISLKSVKGKVITLLRRRAL